MRLSAGQSSCPPIRARYTGSPKSCRSPLSRRRRLIHIYAIKVLPAPRAPRAVRAPQAARSCARSVPRAARARTLWPDSRAPRKQPSPNLNPYSTDALGQSHTVSPSRPLSLPPHCGPLPPARTGPRRPSSLLSPYHVQRAHAHSCQRADNVLFWPAVTLPSFSLRRPPRRRRSPSPPRSAALSPPLSLRR